MHHQSSLNSDRPLALRTEQIVGLDLVRFLAALAVALYHLAGTTWMLPETTAIRQMVGANVSFPQYAWMFYGWVGVEIFFVISGVVIAYSAQSTDTYKFISGRLVRMVPALWICASATALVVWLYGQDHIWQRYLTSVFFLPAGTYIDPSHWTLAIELAFYSVVAALIAAGRTRDLILVMSSVGAVSATAWLLSSLNVVAPPASRTSALLLLQHGVYFSVGVLLHALSNEGFAWKRVALISVFSSAGVLEIMHQTSILESRLVDQKNAMGPVLPIVIWFIALALITVSIFCNRLIAFSPCLNRILRRMGLATYPLYLINAIIGAAILGWLVRFGIPETSALYLTLAFCILCAILVAEWAEPKAKAVFRACFDRIFNRSARATSVLP